MVFVVGPPSYAEERSGMAMDNDVYRIISAFVKSTGLTDEDCVYVCCTNYIKKGAKFTPAELQASWDDYLKEFIEEHPRELVVAMGNDALCALHLHPKPEKINSFRGQLLKLENGVNAGATLNPYVVAKSPDEGDKVAFDLKCVFNHAAGTTKTEIPIKINELDTVGDINDMTHRMLTATGRRRLQLYDHETDNGSAEHALVVMTCFCNGQMTKSGKYKVDAWAPFDKMVPRYGPNKMRKLNAALKEHYMQATLGSKGFNLGAHNRLFDDWCTCSNYFADDYDAFAGSRHDSMIGSYVLDSTTPNGLKDSLHRRCGYPEYDRGVTDEVRAIVKRRGLVLQDVDLEVLARYGHEPVIKVLKGGRESKRWPKTVDKKLCSYSMVDMEILRKYCCFDAAGTCMLHWDQYEEIKSRGLLGAYNYRMKFAEAFTPGERRGFLMDMKTNRRLSKGFQTLEDASAAKMRRWLRKKKIYDEEFIDEFKPSRDTAIREVLYGQPVQVPLVDQEQVLGDIMEFIGKGKKAAVKELASFHNHFYSGFNSEVVETLQSQQEDKEGIEHTTKNLQKEFNAAYGVAKPAVKMTPLYVAGEIRPTVFTKTGLPSVSRPILEAYYDEHPNDFTQLLLIYKKAAKLRSVYVDGLLKLVDNNSIVRPHYNVIGTATGRPSSSRPNGQNFNGYVKGQFVPRPGYLFLEADVKQAEVFTIAAFSHDENLLQAVNSVDVHTVTASLMFGIPVESVGKDSFERKAAKTICFGLIYGMAAPRLALTLGVTEEYAAELMERFFRPYQDLRAWIDMQIMLAKQPPYMLHTAFGTQLSCLGALSVDREEQQHWERVAVNMPIQGSAAEYVMYSIWKINKEIKRMGWDAHFINNIHDSMTYEIAPDLAWKDSFGRIRGPMHDLVVETVGAKPPVAPIDIVRYKLDVELNECWGKKPNINRAVDPKFGEYDHEGNKTSKIRWDLIKADVLNMYGQLDSDELKEFKEIDWERVRLF